MPHKEERDRDSIELQNVDAENAEAELNLTTTPRNDDPAIDPYSRERAAELEASEARTQEEVYNAQERGLRLYSDSQGYPSYGTHMGARVLSGNAAAVFSDNNDELSPRSYGIGTKADDFVEVDGTRLLPEEVSPTETAKTAGREGISKDELLEGSTAKDEPDSTEPTG